MPVHNGICVYIVPSIGQLALKFTVALYTTEAEYMAMTKAIKEAMVSRVA